MADNRPGCNFCFKTLTPHDGPGPVKCDHCGAAYHNEHWQLAGRCLNCGGEKTLPFQSGPITPLRLTSRTRAIPIKPSAVVYVDDKGSGEAGQVYETAVPGQRLQHYGQVARALWLAGFLVAIATALAVFTYRLSLLPEFTAQTALNAILARELPRWPVFIGSLAAGSIFACVFYPQIKSREATAGDDTTGRRLTLWLGGLVMIGSFDLLLFNFSPQDLIQPRFQIPVAALEVLYAQATTALIVLMLTPLHRHLAPVTPLPYKSRSQRVRNVYGWTRLLLVTLLLDMFFVHLATYHLVAAQLGLALTHLALGPIDLALTPPLAGAFLCGLGVAAIAYRSPGFRQVTLSLGIVRLLLFTGCAVGVGLIYTLATSQEAYLGSIASAGLGMLLAAPLQRSLS